MFAGIEVVQQNQSIVVCTTLLLNVNGLYARLRTYVSLFMLWSNKDWESQVMTMSVLVFNWQPYVIHKYHLTNWRRITICPNSVISDLRKLLCFNKKQFLEVQLSSGDHFGADLCSVSFPSSTYKTNQLGHVLKKSKVAHCT